MTEKFSRFTLALEVEMRAPTVTLKQIKSWRWQGYSASATWTDSDGRRHQYGARLGHMPSWAWEREDVTIRIHALGKWREVKKP